MTYYQDDICLIRSMKAADVERIHEAFAQQGWSKEKTYLKTCYAEQEAGARWAFVAEREGQVLGYTMLLPKGRGGPYRTFGYPEVSDFNVFIRYQRKGIGSRILDAAETYAKNLSDRITLGVGLHSGYGAAQRMYIKRGYIPDGSGVWYQGHPLDSYAPCVNDDDLVLYLSKPIR